MRLASGRLRPRACRALSWGPPLPCSFSWTHVVVGCTVPPFPPPYIIFRCQKRYFLWRGAMRIGALGAGMRRRRGSQVVLLLAVAVRCQDSGGGGIFQSDVPPVGNTACALPPAGTAPHMPPRAPLYLLRTHPLLLLLLAGRRCRSA